MYPWKGKGRQELQRGAVTAFREGHHLENLQTFLADPAQFAIYAGCSHEEEILTQLIEGKSTVDAAAVITLAMAKASKEGKQAFLDRRLFHSVFLNEYKGKGEGLVVALLEAGADASGVHESSKGLPLAHAVHWHWPQSVTDLFYKKGASYDDALSFMIASNWSADAKEDLKDSWEKFTGAPADIFNAASAAKATAPDKKPQPLVMDQEVIDAIAALEINKRAQPRPAAR